MTDRGALRELARLHGIQLGYREAGGGRRGAPARSLLAALRALGVPAERERDAPALLADARRERDRRALEPAVVVEAGVPTEVVLRGSARSAAGEDEGGAAFAVRLDGDAARLPALAAGYHRLALSGPRGEHRATVLAAPRRAHPLAGRPWGLFAPVYALRSDRDWGAGTLSELAELARVTAALGGGLVATLPLLPVEPGTPSPYSPLTRRAWGELWADLDATPEMAGTPEARTAREAAAPGIQALRAAELVDYAALEAVRARVLAPLAAAAWADPARRAAIERLARERPALARYAAWRAGGHPAAGRLHLYAQLVADEQLAAAAAAGAGLVFDLPLGVHPHGFDAADAPGWFADGATVGAPPDPFMAAGQDWGFAPPHPERMREAGYALLAESLRHHLHHAAALRVDHVMGAHRLFWVPDGLSPAEGVYVRYRGDELHAVMRIESARAGAAIVGENLGTVPTAVDRALRRDGILGMAALQFMIDPDRDPAVAEPSAGAVAMLNTHDMPTFAAWARALDVEDRVDLGQLDAGAAAGERRGRARARAALAADLARRGLAGADPDDRGLLLGALRRLAGSRAAAVVVALEDAWLETRPQNVPGTGAERPNWRRRVRFGVEELGGRPDLRAAADALGTPRGMQRT